MSIHSIKLYKVYTDCTVLSSKLLTDIIIIPLTMACCPSYLGH